MGKWDSYVPTDVGAGEDLDKQLGKGGGLPRVKVVVGSPRKLRILKRSSDPLYYIIRKQHWSIPIGIPNSPPLACAKAHADAPCFFCLKTNEFYNSGDPRKFAIAGKVKATPAVIVQVLDLDDVVNTDGTPKIQVFHMTWNLHMDLKKYFSPDLGYGDICHPGTGRNIKVMAEKVSEQRDGEQKREWTKYSVAMSANPSEIPDPRALDCLYDLDKEYPVKLYSFDQQQAIFEGRFNPSVGALSPGEVTKSLGAGKDEFETAVTTTTESSGEFAPTESSASVEVVSSVASSEEADDWSDVSLDDSEEEEDPRIKEVRQKLAEMEKMRGKK